MGAKATLLKLLTWALATILRSSKQVPNSGHADSVHAHAIDTHCPPTTPHPLPSSNIVSPHFMP